MYNSITQVAEYNNIRNIRNTNTRYITARTNRIISTIRRTIVLNTFLITRFKIYRNAESTKEYIKYILV